MSWAGQGQLLSQPFKVLVPPPHFILTLGKAVRPCGLLDGTEKDEVVETRNRGGEEQEERRVMDRVEGENGRKEAEGKREEGG